MITLNAGEQLVEVGWAYGMACARDSDAGAWFFAAKDDVDNIEDAMRAAIADHLKKPDANPNKVAFNWGDAMNELTEEDWAKHGLRFLSLPPHRHINVDHDETFKKAT